VGNKADIAEREVTKKELEEYAEKNRYPYIEVSAKSGTGIHSLFRKIAEKLIDIKNGSKPLVESTTTATDKSNKDLPIAGTKISLSR
jgi:50S ribosomal subunit-associated GTPase HflX